MNNNIPKIIHYCWFGTKEIPAQEKADIEGAIKAGVSVNRYKL